MLWLISSNAAENWPWSSFVRHIEPYFFARLVSCIKSNKLYQNNSIRLPDSFLHIYRNHWGRRCCWFRWCMVLNMMMQQQSTSTYDIWRFRPHFFCFKSEESTIVSTSYRQKLLNANQPFPSIWIANRDRAFFFLAVNGDLVVRDPTYGDHGT